jgi:hypothetical protein
MYKNYNPTQEILNRLQICPEDKTLYELCLLEGESLSMKELKILNQNGFLYDSEITEVDYENEDGSVDYMNLYYFKKS